MEKVISAYNETEQTIINLEKKLITAVYNNQPEILKKLLTPNAIFVSGKHGYVNVEALISGLAYHPKVLQWELSNMRFIGAPSSHSMIVTYQGHQVLFDNTKLSQYSTSIWVKEMDEWQLAFHQKSNAPLTNG